MTPSQIILTIKACILLGLLSLAYWLGGQGARADFADYKTKMIAATAKVADKALETERKVRAGEHAKAAELAAIADKYEKDRNDAEAAADRTIAGLRAGTDKLRAQWQGCKATAQLSGAVSSAVSVDGQDRLREEDLRNVRRWAELLQAQRDGLQAVTEVDRK